MFGMMGKSELGLWDVWDDGKSQGFQSVKSYLKSM